VFWGGGGLYVEGGWGSVGLGCDCVRWYVVRLCVGVGGCRGGG